MDISKNLLVGESISYAKEEIILSLEKDEIPSKSNWFVITTTYEPNNLFYILSWKEYRHPMYHRDKSPKPENAMAPLKIFGLAGSWREATSMIQDFVEQFIDSDSVMDLKRIIEDW